MTKDIVVELTRAANGFPKGTELGYASEAKATSVLGEGAFKVVRNQDGTAVEVSKPNPAPRKRPSRAKKPVQAQSPAPSSTPLPDVVEG